MQSENGLLELALDDGILFGGGQTIPLCEVEIELKTGSEEAARTFAKALAAEFCLQEETASKAQRAMALRN